MCGLDVVTLEGVGLVSDMVSVHKIAQNSRTDSDCNKLNFPGILNSHGLIGLLLLNKKVLSGSEHKSRFNLGG